MQSEECRHIAGVSPADVNRYAIYRLAGQLAAPDWRNGLSLAFPPSDVASLEGDAVTPACIGLLGVAGTLPYCYTEAIAHRGGQAARAFMDLLSAPAVDLFCAAWREARPEYTPLPAVPLRRGPPRARALGELLAQALKAPVRVEQFAGQWESLPGPQRSALGASNASCGAGTVLGTRFWRLDGAVWVHVGPLRGDAAHAFLPGGPGALALARLWRGASGDCQVPAVARIHVLPEAGEVARLGDGVRLGYDVLLGAQDGAERDDLRYRLC